MGCRSSYRPNRKIKDPGRRIVSSVFDEKPKLTPACHQLVDQAIPMLTRNARKIATPPKRGSGLLCKCLSSPGATTQPRAVAKFRTYLVRTKEKSTEAANIPR